MEFVDKMKISKIFEGIGENDLKAFNFCFKTKILNFSKNSVIVNEDEPLESIFLVLDGHIRSYLTDYYGNISIIEDHYPGDAIGIEEAFGGVDTAKYSLIAIENTTILEMNKYRVIKPCENQCPRHLMLQNNLVKMISKKNLELFEKFNHITKHSTRDKVLAYLMSASKKASSQYFDIPFNRQELADYLSVDRSALSFELSKMKKEGLIDFSKNHFLLKK